MHQLLCQPLEPASVVRPRPAVVDEVLDHLPLLRLTEAFLRLLHRNGPPCLTPSRALPRQCLHEFYASGFIRKEGQVGWAYSLYLLARFGHLPQPVHF